MLFITAGLQDDSKGPKSDGWEGLQDFLSLAVVVATVRGAKGTFS